MPKKPQDYKAKIVHKSNLITIKKTPATGEIAVEVADNDQRKITSRFNRMEHGKRANLPTLLCDECPYGSSKSVKGATGQCDKYQPKSFCAFDHQFIKLRGGEHIRDVNVLSEKVNRTVFMLELLCNRALSTIGFDGNGGIPDRATDRLFSQALNWQKFARELIAPRMHAKQTEIFKDDQGLSMLIKEVYNQEAVKPADKPASEDDLTFGLKSKGEQTKDSMEELAKLHQQERDDLL